MSGCGQHRGKTGELYILGALRPELTGQDANVLIEQTAHRLHDMLQQYVDVSCMIGIGQGENTAGGMARRAVERRTPCVAGFTD